MSIPHDQRVALMNQIFREQVVPRLPNTEGACLIVFDGSANPQGLLCYIGTHERLGMRNVLSKLLTKWDAELLGQAYRSTDVPNGMRAYEGWRQRLLRAVRPGSSMAEVLKRPWEDLSEEEMEAWEQAAVAVRV